MTFLQMCRETALALELDWDTQTDPVKQLIRQGINTAYVMIARDKWKPLMTETVLPQEGNVPLDSLQECFLSLKSVTCNGRPISAWAGKDFLHVPVWTKEAVASYYYIPVPMKEDSDIPVMSAAQVDPHAFIYYAASFYCSVKKMHTEAAVWDRRYRNMTDSISQMRGQVTLPVGRWR